MSEKMTEDQLWDSLGGGPAAGDLKAPKTEVVPNGGRRRARLARVAALPPTTEGGTKTPFEIAHPTVVAWLTGYKGTFPFYLSLKEQYERRGDLSEKQTEAIYRAVERDGIVVAKPENLVLKALKIVREAQAENMGSAKEMLKLIDAAIAIHSGPEPTPAPVQVFTLAVGERVRVSKFQAKIIGEKAGLTRAHFVFEVKEVLRETPKAWLVKLESVSQRSGHCCVCGLTLTNPESVSKGIGPVCGDGYELNWNSDKDVLEQLAEKLRVVSSVVETWLPKSAIKERIKA